MVKQYNYNNYAEYYDELDGSVISYKEVSRDLHKIMKPYGTKILDVACGTGNFTSELKKLRYSIEGCDISDGMLRIAKKKFPKIKFFKADMRKLDNKKYDVILCMFNAIGHLNKDELQKTINEFNKKSNVIIFDIINFNFMEKKFIKNEFIDKCKESNGIKFVRFNNNSLDKKNKIMNINQSTLIQKNNVIKRINESWQMKIYTKEDIKEILNKAGFKIKKIMTFSDKGLKNFSKGNMSMVFIAENNNTSKIH